MQKVIEQDGDYSLKKDASQLNEDIFPASLPEQLSEDISTFQHDSSLITPKQKLVRDETADQDPLSNFSLSSCSSNSGIYVREASDTSSLSPDFDSESYSSSPDGRSKLALNGVKMALQGNHLDTENGLPSMDKNYLDCTSNLMVNRECEMVLKRVIDHGHELLVSSKNIHVSEEEIMGLKYELERNEAVAKLMVFMKVKLDSAESEVKMQKADLEMDNRKIWELEKHVALLESRISDSDIKIETLESELEITREKLEATEEEVTKLKHDCSKVITENTCYLADQLESTQEELVLLKTKLDSEEKHALELQENIMRYKADISNRDQEIKRISVLLEDAQENFCTQKAHFHYQIDSFSEQQALLEARIELLEIQNRSLELEVRQCEAEKTEMKNLHEAKEISWKSETECLKMEIKNKDDEVQAVNKDLDKLKLEYDMLMAEKDGVTIQIQEKEADLKELIVRCESAQIRVEELQKEVERQTLLISDRAEEKREAIRQLCLSLEHYRSGYQELLQAYLGPRRRAIAAT